MIQTLLPLAVSLPLAACPAGAPTGQDGDPPIPECTAETVTLESGLQYCVLHEGGDGKHAQMGDLVKVDYTGWLLDGTSFDTSRKPRRPGLEAQPAEFAIGGVIPGWNEALQLMSPGDHWKVTIPADLAYGKEGSPPKIGPNKDLIFEIELHDIVQEVPRFVEWLDEAEGIERLPNGIAYRVLDAGTGPTIAESGQGNVAFTLYNMAGEVVTSHTMNRLNGGLSVSTDSTPIPFFSDVLGVLRKDSRVQVKVPSALGLGGMANGRPIPELPDAADEIWIVEPVMLRPVFRMPTPEELTTTESGLQYVVVSEGEGEPPTASDRVSVDYVGWFKDGESFDASFNRGQPATFGVGQVIKGWTEGLQLMKPGSEVIFVIPADLAYGSNPPPNFRKDADLVFYVKLHEVLGR